MKQLFRLDPYREYNFPTPLKEWFEAVEKALGFKLFFWQKTFIERGNFRCYGETTAVALRELSEITKPPLDLTEYRRKPQRERIYYEELLKIKEILDDAGVPTRKVATSKQQLREYMEEYKKAKEIERCNAGQTDRKVKQPKIIF